MALTLTLSQREREFLQRAAIGHSNSHYPMKLEENRQSRRRVWEPNSTIPPKAHKTRLEGSGTGASARTPSIPIPPPWVPPPLPKNHRSLTQTLPPQPAHP